jgi:hypothetical protein
MARPADQAEQAYGLWAAPGREEELIGRVGYELGAWNIDGGQGGEHEQPRERARHSHGGRSKLQHNNVQQ